MRLHAPLLALTGICLLPACSATPKSPLESRKAAYQKLLSMIEPGMTRRQLYALLPPAQRPSAEPPSWASITGSSQSYWSHDEKYPLDRDFAIRVEYRLASQKEFRTYDLQMHRGFKSIDDLLADNQPQPLSIPSRQNMDDEILSRPILVHISNDSRPLLRMYRYDDLSIPDAATARQ